jgi:hypothetical protein
MAADEAACDDGNKSVDLENAYFHFIRAAVLSDSHPTGSPYRRTLSRVCSNAWFATPLVCSGTSGLSDEQTRFRVKSKSERS